MGVQKGHLPRKKPKWPKVARLGTVSTEVFDGLNFSRFGGSSGIPKQALASEDTKVAKSSPFRYGFHRGF